MTGVSPDRRRLSTMRVVVTAAILLVGTALAAEAVSRLFYAPWSIGAFGRETLTGSWSGGLRARQGAEYGLALELAYRRRDGSYRRSGAYRTNNLEGRATLCTPGGGRYEYAVSGFARPSGAVEMLWLEYGDPTLSALNLRLSGAWQPPVLNLTADANPFLPDGSFVPSRALGGDAPDDSFAPIELRKGTIDGLAACRARRQ